MPDPGRAAWRVCIPAHTIPRRSIGGVALDQDPYQVPATETISYEPSKRDALRFAVQDAHIDAGIPSWKEYERVTRALTTLEAVVVSAVNGTMTLDPETGRP